MYNHSHQHQHQPTQRPGGHPQHKYPTFPTVMNPSFQATQKTHPAFPDGPSFESYPRRPITCPYHRAHQSFPDSRPFEDRPRQQIASASQSEQQPQKDTLARDQRHDHSGDTEAARREMIAAEQASNRAFEKYRDACKLYKRAKDHIFHNNEMEWNRRNEAKIRGDMAFETFEAQSLRDKRLGSFEDHERIARGQYDRAARPGASFQDAHTPDSTHRWRRDRAKPVDDSYIRAVMELEHQKMLAEDRKEEAKKHEQEGTNLAEVEFQPWLMRVGDHWDQAKRREQEETGLARADRELRWMEEEDRREQARKRELEELRLANAKLEQRWMEEEARREKAKKREQAQYIIITNPNIRGIAKSRSIIPSRELGPDERGRRRPRPSFSRKDASLVEAESTSTDQSDDESATSSEQESTSTDQSDDESATSSEQESSSADQSDEQETDSKSSIKETCSHHATVETAPDSTVEDLGSKFIPDRILRSSESDKSKVEVVDGTSVVEKKEEDEGTNEDETKKGKDGEKEETPDGSMTKGEDVEGNGKGKAQ